MPVFELINPSDPYTFVAPSLEVAAVCAAMLSTGFGARQVDPPADETSPVLLGWDEWLADRGIDRRWIEAHESELADAFESFLIGNLADRRDVEEALALIPAESREAWRARRQERHRTSINDIGESAYRWARRLRSACSGSVD